MPFLDVNLALLIISDKHPAVANSDNVILPLILYDTELFTISNWELT